MPKRKRKGVRWQAWGAERGRVALGLQRKPWDWMGGGHALGVGGEVLVWLEEEEREILIVSPFSPPAALSPALLLL
jgi:hypothetical protein